MNKKISFGVALTIAIMFSTVTFIMTMIYAQNDFNGKVYDLQQREKMYQKLSEVDTRVRKDFYGNIDEEVLKDNIVKGYVNGLGDKYAMYLTAEQHAQAMGGFEGQMVDIGIIPEPDLSGYIKVVKVKADSPAFLSGIEPGDIITKVDDLAVNVDNYDVAVDAFKGEPGTDVILTVRHGGSEKTHTITRRRVEIVTTDSYVIEGVGVIRITEFNDNTLSQFKNALDNCIAQGAKGIIFDVRNNPGGTMESVAEILDMILPQGPIVSSTDKEGKTTVLYESDSSELIFPMACLINGKSASAAELFAQALKDYQKAKLVGTQTFGKGSMQKIFPLSDGSALDITVALYNPPKSPNFDGIGVKPDFEIKLAPDLEDDIGVLDISADAQLRKALEVVKSGIRKDGTSDTSEEPSKSSSSEGEESSENNEEGSSSSEESEDVSSSEDSSSDLSSSEEDSREDSSSKENGKDDSSSKENSSENSTSSKSADKKEKSSSKQR